MLGGAPDIGAVGTKPTLEEVETAALEADAEQVLEARTATAKARTILVPTGVLAVRVRQENICACSRW